LREIKFRGKRLDNGQWVYGYLHMEERDGEYPTIVEGGGFSKHLGVWLVPVIQVIDELIVDSYEVDPATVGQYTGINNIYEHDCLEAYWPDGKLRESTVVRWMENGQWNISRERVESRGHRIVGNIHEVKS
jgi:hypothetical protein